jgi:hypothetical protein
MSIKNITIITSLVIATSLFGLALLTENQILLVLSQFLMILATVNALLNLTQWVMLSYGGKGFGSTAEHDLRYVGFIRAIEDFMGEEVSLSESSRGLIVLGTHEPTKLKPANRIKAFLFYGFASTFRQELSNETHINELGNIKQNFINASSRKHYVRSLVFRTIKSSRKVLRNKALSSYDNPNLYAAYLFRMASLHGNPEDKDVQEKALILWQDKRDLKITTRLRECTITDLKTYKDLPDNWVLELFQLNITNTTEVA